MQRQLASSLSGARLADAVVSGLLRSRCGFCSWPASLIRYRCTCPDLLPVGHRLSSDRIVGRSPNHLRGAGGLLDGLSPCRCVCCCDGCTVAHWRAMRKHIAISFLHFNYLQAYVVKGVALACQNNIYFRTWTHSTSNPTFKA